MVRALVWPELTLSIYYAQVTSSTGNGASTLALKPMGGVNQSPKQRVPVVPQIGHKIFFKKFKKVSVQVSKKNNSVSK